jgi:glycosyltransferase involved in cell wall biosynthesis
MIPNADKVSNLPLISVIVPVYNVKPYLRECFESIVNQTYRSFEIILVDDGSTDGSGELCDSLVEPHEHASVIHKDNGGMSHARDAGLAAAKGEWVAFVDSDDFISPIFLEVLYIVVCKSETLMATVRYGVSFFDGHSPELEMNLEAAMPYRVETDEEYQEELLYQKSWNGVVWRLCHKSLFENVKFPIGLYYEDAATTYRLVHEVDRVAVLETTKLYAYRQNECGVMRGSFNDAKLESCLTVTRTMRDEVSCWYPALSDAVCSRCFAICRVVFSQVPENDEVRREMLWMESQIYAKTVLFDPKARKREKIAAAISKLGRVPFQVFCNVYRSVLHAQ